MMGGSRQLNVSLVALAEALRDADRALILGMYQADHALGSESGEGMV
jgi:hypothetical protein